MQYAPQEAPPDVSSTTVASAAPARFDWSEYEQLMISEAIHRGETVFNIALRVDQASGMRAAAFQLIRNVLHGCGTVIALRPEDNVAAASVEVIEASLATNVSRTDRTALPHSLDRARSGWKQQDTPTRRTPIARRPAGRAGSAGSRRSF